MVGDLRRQDDDLARVVLLHQFVDLAGAEDAATVEMLQLAVLVEVGEAPADSRVRRDLVDAVGVQNDLAVPVFLLQCEIGRLVDQRMIGLAVAGIADLIDLVVVGQRGAVEPFRRGAGPVFVPLLVVAALVFRDDIGADP